MWWSWVMTCSVMAGRALAKTWANSIASPLKVGDRWKEWLMGRAAWGMCTASRMRGM